MKKEAPLTITASDLNYDYDKETIWQVAHEAAPSVSMPTDKDISRWSKEIETVGENGINSEKARKIIVKGIQARVQLSVGGILRVLLNEDQIGKLKKARKSLKCLDEDPEYKKQYDRTDKKIRDREAFKPKMRGEIQFFVQDYIQTLMECGHTKSSAVMLASDIMAIGQTTIYKLLKTASSVLAKNSNLRSEVCLTKGFSVR